MRFNRYNRKQALILGIVLLVVVLVIRLFSPGTTNNLPGRKQTNGTEEPVKINPRSPEASDGRETFNRKPGRLIYTKHARCRMDCRRVTEAEVEKILMEGEINYLKSDLRAQPDPRYALEGYSSDGQHLRIIFAPSRRGMVVITCIDLEKDWQCDCK